MRVWLTCFLALFAVVELFDWVQKFSLPLPIYILGGAFLAVASNYDKLFGSYVSEPTRIAPSEQPQLYQENNSPTPLEGSQPLLPRGDATRTGESIVLVTSTEVLIAGSQRSEFSQK